MFGQLCANAKRNRSRYQQAQNVTATSTFVDFHSARHINNRSFVLFLPCIPFRNFVSNRNTNRINGEKPYHMSIFFVWEKWTKLSNKVPYQSNYKCLLCLHARSSFEDSAEYSCVVDAKVWKSVHNNTRSQFVYVLTQSVRQNKLIDDGNQHSEICRKRRPETAQRYANAQCSQRQKKVPVNFKYNENAIYTKRRSFAKRITNDVRIREPVPLDRRLAWKSHDLFPVRPAAAHVEQRSHTLSTTWFASQRRRREPVTREPIPSSFSICTRRNATTRIL